MGKTTIAFFNIEDMGPLAKCLTMLIIMGLFGAVGKFFHANLWEKEPDLNEQRKEALRLRKEKKGQ